MKRLFLGLPLLLVLTIGPGLGQQDKQDKIVRTYPSDLLPLKVGNRWVYQGADPKEKVTVAVDRMEPVKHVVKAPGIDRVDTIESYVLRTTNGDKVLQEQIAITEDGIYRVAVAGKEIKPWMKILKLPPARDDAWTVDSKSENVDLKGEVHVEQATVNLGKGDEPVWLAKTRDFKIGDQPMESSYWFKPGVGIVKQHVKSGKFEFRIVLEAFVPAAGADLAPGLPPPPKLSTRLDRK